MKDSTERLKAMYRRFLKLSPARKAEFLKSIEKAKQLAEGQDVLEIFEEIELIFKEAQND